jgi:hypothetical protein
MNGRHFTMGHLAAAVTSGNEQLMRKLLNDAGASPHFSEYVEDPLQRVPVQLVINLAALRAGDWVGNKVARLLLGETAEIW